MDLKSLGWKFLSKETFGDGKFKHCHKTDPHTDTHTRATKKKTLRIRIY